MPDLVTVLNAAIQILIGLVGFPAALAAALAIAMKFGLAADVASMVSFVAQVVVFVGIVYLVVTGQSALVQVIDATLGNVAKFLVDILIILGGPAITGMLTAHFTRSIAGGKATFAEAKRLL